MDENLAEFDFDPAPPPPRRLNAANLASALSPRRRARRPRRSIIGHPSNNINTPARSNTLHSAVEREAASESELDGASSLIRSTAAAAAANPRPVRRGAAAARPSKKIDFGENPQRKAKATRRAAVSAQSNDIGQFSNSNTQPGGATTSRTAASSQSKQLPAHSNLSASNRNCMELRSAPLPRSSSNLRYRYSVYDGRSDSSAYLGQYSGRYYHTTFADDFDVEEEEEEDDDDWKDDIVRKWRNSDTIPRRSRRIHEASVNASSPHVERTLNFEAANSEPGNSEPMSEGLNEGEEDDEEEEENRDDDDDDGEASILDRSSHIGLNDHQISLESPFEGFGMEEYGDVLPQLNDSGAAEGRGQESNEDVMPVPKSGDAPNHSVNDEITPQELESDAADEEVVAQPLDTEELTEGPELRPPDQKVVALQQHLDSSQQTADEEARTEHKIVDKAQDSESEEVEKRAETPLVGTIQRKCPESDVTVEQQPETDDDHNDAVDQQISSAQVQRTMKRKKSSSSQTTNNASDTTSKNAVRPPESGEKERSEKNAELSDEPENVTEPSVNKKVVPRTKSPRKSKVKISRSVDDFVLALRSNRTGSTKNVEVREQAQSQRAIEENIHESAPTTENRPRTRASVNVEQKSVTTASRPKRSAAGEAKVRIVSSPAATNKDKSQKSAVVEEKRPKTRASLTAEQKSAVAVSRPKRSAAMKAKERIAPSLLSTEKEVRESTFIAKKQQRSHKSLSVEPKSATVASRPKRSAAEKANLHIAPSLAANENKAQKSTAVVAEQQKSRVSLNAEPKLPTAASRPKHSATEKAKECSALVLSASEKRVQEAAGVPNAQKRSKTRASSNAAQKTPIIASKPKRSTTGKAKESNPPSVPAIEGKVQGSAVTSVREEQPGTSSSLNVQQKSPIASRPKRLAAEKAIERIASSLPESKKNVLESAILAISQKQLGTGASSNTEPATPACTSTPKRSTFGKAKAGFSHSVSGSDGGPQKSDVVANAEKRPKASTSSNAKQKSETIPSRPKRSTTKKATDCSAPSLSASEERIQEPAATVVTEKQPEISPSRNAEQESAMLASKAKCLFPGDAVIRITPSLPVSKNRVQESATVSAAVTNQQPKTVVSPNTEQKSTPIASGHKRSTSYKATTNISPSLSASTKKKHGSAIDVENRPKTRASMNTEQESSRISSRPKRSAAEKARFRISDSSKPSRKAGDKGKDKVTTTTSSQNQDSNLPASNVALPKPTESSPVSNVASVSTRSRKRLKPVTKPIDFAKRRKLLQNDIKYFETEIPKLWDVQNTKTKEKLHTKRRLKKASESVSTENIPDKKNVEARPDELENNALRSSTTDETAEQVNEESRTRNDSPNAKSLSKEQTNLKQSSSEKKKPVKTTEEQVTDKLTSREKRLAARKKEANIEQRNENLTPREKRLLARSSSAKNIAEKKRSVKKNIKSRDAQPTPSTTVQPQNITAPATRQAQSTAVLLSPTQPDKFDPNAQMEDEDEVVQEKAKASTTSAVLDKLPGPKSTLSSNADDVEGENKDDVTEQPSSNVTHAATPAKEACEQTFNIESLSELLVGPDNLMSQNIISNRNVGTLERLAAAAVTSVEMVERVEDAVNVQIKEIMDVNPEHQPSIPRTEEGEALNLPDVEITENGSIEIEPPLTDNITERRNFDNEVALCSSDALLPESSIEGLEMATEIVEKLVDDAAAEHSSVSLGVTSAQPEKSENGEVDSNPSLSDASSPKPSKQALDVATEIVENLVDDAAAERSIVPAAVTAQLEVWEDEEMNFNPSLPTPSPEPSKQAVQVATEIVENLVEDATIFSLGVTATQPKTRENGGVNLDSPPCAASSPAVSNETLEVATKIVEKLVDDATAATSSQTEILETEEVNFNPSISAASSPEASNEALEVTTEIVQKLVDDASAEHYIASFGVTPVQQEILENGEVNVYSSLSTTSSPDTSKEGLEVATRIVEKLVDDVSAEHSIASFGVTSAQTEILDNEEVNFNPSLSVALSPETAKEALGVANRIIENLLDGVVAERCNVSFGIIPAVQYEVRKSRETDAGSCSSTASSPEISDEALEAVNEIMESLIDDLSINQSTVSSKPAQPEVRETMEIDANPSAPAATLAGKLIDATPSNNKVPDSDGVVEPESVVHSNVASAPIDDSAKRTTSEAFTTVDSVAPFSVAPTQRDSPVNDYSERVVEDSLAPLPSPLSPIVLTPFRTDFAHLKLLYGDTNDESAVEKSCHVPYSAETELRTPVDDSHTSELAVDSAHANPDVRVIDIEMSQPTADVASALQSGKQDTEMKSIEGCTVESAVVTWAVSQDEKSAEKTDSDRLDSSEDSDEVDADALPLPGVAHYVVSMEDRMQVVHTNQDVDGTSPVTPEEVKSGEPISKTPDMYKNINLSSAVTVETPGKPVIKAVVTTVSNPPEKKILSTDTLCSDDEEIVALLSGQMNVEPTDNSRTVVRDGTPEIPDVCAKKRSPVSDTKDNCTEEATETNTVSTSQEMRPSDDCPNEELVEPFVAPEKMIEVEEGEIVEDESMQQVVRTEVAEEDGVATDMPRAATSDDGNDDAMTSENIHENYDTEVASLVPSAEVENENNVVQENINIPEVCVVQPEELSKLGEVFTSEMVHDESDPCDANPAAAAECPGNEDGANEKAIGSDSVLKQLEDENPVTDRETSTREVENTETKGDIVIDPGQLHVDEPVTETKASEKESVNDAESEEVEESSESGTENETNSVDNEMATKDDPVNSEGSGNDLPTEETEIAQAEATLDILPSSTIRAKKSGVEVDGGVVVFSFANESLSESNDSERQSQICGDGESKRTSRQLQCESEAVASDTSSDRAIDKCTADKGGDSTAEDSRLKKAEKNEARKGQSDGEEEEEKEQGQDPFDAYPDLAAFFSDKAIREVLGSDGNNVIDNEEQYDNIENSAPAQLKRGLSDCPKLDVPYQPISTGAHANEVTAPQHLPCSSSSDSCPEDNALKMRNDDSAGSAQEFGLSQRNMPRRTKRRLKMSVLRGPTVDNDAAKDSSPTSPSKATNKNSSSESTAPPRPSVTKPPLPVKSQPESQKKLVPEKIPKQSKSSSAPTPSNATTPTPIVADTPAKAHVNRKRLSQELDGKTITNATQVPVSNRSRKKAKMSIISIPQARNQDSGDATPSPKCTVGRAAELDPPIHPTKSVLAQNERPKALPSENNAAEEPRLPKTRSVDPNALDRRKPDARVNRPQEGNHSNHHPNPPTSAAKTKKTVTFDEGATEIIHIQTTSFDGDSDSAPHSNGDSSSRLDSVADGSGDETGNTVPTKRTNVARKAPRQSAKRRRTHLIPMSERNSDSDSDGNYQGNRRERMRSSVMGDTGSSGRGGKDDNFVRKIAEDLQHYWDCVFRGNRENGDIDPKLAAPALMKILKLFRQVKRNNQQAHFGGPDHGRSLLHDRLRLSGELKQVVAGLSKLVSTHPAPIPLLSMSILTIIADGGNTAEVFDSSQIEIFVNGFYGTCCQQPANPEQNDDASNEQRKGKAGRRFRKAEDLNEKVLAEVRKALSDNSILDGHGLTLKNFRDGTQIASVLSGVVLAKILGESAEARELMIVHNRLPRITSIMYRTVKRMVSLLELKAKATPSQSNMLDDERNRQMSLLGVVMFVLESMTHNQSARERVAVQSQAIPQALGLMRKLIMTGELHTDTAECFVTNTMRLMINLVHGYGTGNDKFAGFNGVQTTIDCLAQSIGTANGRYRRKFDIVVLCLALLVSLVDGSVAIRDQFQDHSPTNQVKHEYGAIAFLLHLLKVMGSSSTNDNGEGMTQDRIMENKVITGYLCLLLGALVRQCPRNREAIRNSLPGRTLSGLPVVIEDFLDFHHSAGVNQSDINAMYQRIIDGLKVEERLAVREDQMALARAEVERQVSDMENDVESEEDE